MIRASLLNGNNQIQDYDLSKLIQAFRTQGVVTWLNVTTNTVNPGYAFISVTRGSQTWLMLVDIPTAETISTSGTKKVWIDIDQTKVDDPSSNPVDGTTIARIQTGAAYPGTTHIKLASISSWAITDEREYSTFALIAALAQNQTFTGNNTFNGSTTFANFPTKSWGLTPTTDGQLATKKYVDDIAAALMTYATQNEVNAWSNTTKAINPNTLANYRWRTYAWTAYTAGSHAGAGFTNTTYQKKYEWTVAVPWIYTVAFKLRTDNASYAVTWRIYKNWVAYWTERSTTSTWDVTYTEDLFFAEWDVIEFWGKVAWATTYYLTAMSIKYDVVPNLTSAAAITIA